MTGPGRRSLLLKLCFCLALLLQNRTSFFGFLWLICTDSLTMATNDYFPEEAQIVDAVRPLYKANPGIGIKKVYEHLHTEQPTWKVSIKVPSPSLYL